VGDEHAAHDAIIATFAQKRREDGLAAAEIAKAIGHEPCRQVIVTKLEAASHRSAGHREHRRRLPIADR